MNKRFQWEPFSAWLLIYAIGIFLRHEVSVNHEVPMDYSWLVLSSTICWFSVAMFMFHNGLEYNLNRTEGWELKMALPCLFSAPMGAVAAISGFCVVIMPVLRISNMPVEHEQIIINLMLGSFAYFLLSVLLIWTPCRARKNCLAVVDKKILYPEEKFWIWPFFEYDIQEIKQQTIFSFEDLWLNCQDMSVKVIANGRVSVPFEEIMHSKIRLCNVPIFTENLHEQIRRVLESAANNMTVADMVEGGFKAKQFIVASLPVYWDGTINIVPVLE
ncbi:MAG: hypothetical protein WED06_01490 [Candidatus Paceibacterota bacterium]